MGIRNKKSIEDDFEQFKRPLKYEEFSAQDKASGSNDFFKGGKQDKAESSFVAMGNGHIIKEIFSVIILKILVAVIVIAIIVAGVRLFINSEAFLRLLDFINEIKSS